MSHHPTSLNRNWVAGSASDPASPFAATSLPPLLPIGGRKERTAKVKAFWSVVERLAERMWRRRYRRLPRRAFRPRNTPCGSFRMALQESAMLDLSDPRAFVRRALDECAELIEEDRAPHLTVWAIAAHRVLERESGSLSALRDRVTQEAAAVLEEAQGAAEAQS